MGRYLPNHGRLRPSRSPLSYPTKGILPGRNGLSRSLMSSNLPRIAVSSTMARVTISTGFALERLVTVKGLSDPATLLARKEAWADAYRHTPHGNPVELGAATANAQRRSK